MKRIGEGLSCLSDTPEAELSASRQREGRLGGCPTVRPLLQTFFLGKLHSIHSKETVPRLTRRCKMEPLITDKLSYESLSVAQNGVGQIQLPHSNADRGMNVPVGGDLLSGCRK